MSSASPLKRSLKLPPSPSHISLSPSRRHLPLSSLYEDILSGPFLDSDQLQSRSHARTQELAKGFIPETEALNELQSQLVTRDQYIEKLKERLIDVKTEAKAGDGEGIRAKERLIQQICKEKLDLVKMVQSLEEEIHRRDKDSGLRDGEKTALKAEIEEIRTQNAALQGQIHTKEALIESMKADLSQLSEIIQGMTALNTDLNDKVLKQNEEMEDRNREYYEAIAKSQHAEEVEKMLQEVTAEKQKLEGKIERLIAESQGFATTAEQIKKEFASFQGELPSEFHPKAIQIYTLLSQLEPSAAGKQADPSSLQAKITLLQSELLTKRQQILTLQTSETALSTRLNRLEADHKLQLQSSATVIKQLNETIATLQQGVGGLVDRYEGLRREYEKVAGEKGKCEAKLEFLQGKLEKTLQGLNHANKSAGLVKDFQAQFTQLKGIKHSLEAALVLRDQKAKTDAAHIKVLSEELWKRDTHILKQGKETVKLEEQIGRLRLLLAQAKARHSPDVVNRTSEARLPRLSAKARRRSSSKSLLITRQSASIYYEKTQQLLETISRGLEALSIANSGDTPPWQLVKSVLGQHRAESGNLKADLVERLWQYINDLEDRLGRATELVPLDFIPGKSRKWLQLRDEKSYTSGELLSAVKDALRDAERAMT